MPDGLEKTPSRIRSHGILLGLTLLTLAAFWPVRNHEFINYDDDRYIVKNPYLVEGFSWKGIQWAFTADLTEDSPYVDYWQPVTLLSRLLDGELFGLDGPGHHRMNLILHILNGLMLFLLLRDLTGAVGRSALVAGLFALHPLQVEPVAWVTARKDLLGFCFALLAVRSYSSALQKPSSRGNGAVLLFFILALMSKSVWVILPFLLLLLDFWPLGRRDRGKAVFEKVPLFAVSAFFLFLPFLGQPDALSYAPPMTVFSQVPSHYLSYIEKFFWPSPLYIESAFIPSRLDVGKMWITGFFLVFFSLLTVLEARRHPGLAVGWFWFLISLAPAVGLPRIDDRFMYVPLVGLALAVVWSLSDLLAAFRRGKVVLGILAIALLTVLIPSTFAQAGIWKNSFTLFEHALRVKPDNYLAYSQLGAAWLDRKNFEKSIAASSRALALKPDLDKARYNLALALAGENRWEEAIHHYTEALRLRPDYLEAHSNLAFAFASQGKWEEAHRHYLAALRLKSDSAETHNNLGSLLLRRGQVEEAVSHYREALRIQPDAAYVRENLALALAARGKHHEVRH